MRIPPHISLKLSARSTAALMMSAAFMMSATLSSCGDNEPDAIEPQEISLRTSARATRAAEPIDTDYNMWVTALYHNNNAGNYFLKDYLFKYNHAMELWRGAPPVCYPLNGKLDFVAYAATNADHKPNMTYTPAIGIPPILNDEARISFIKLDFSTKGNSTKPSNRLDGSDDVLVSEITQDVPCGTEAPTEVPLNFQHLLCNVRFNFIAETQEAESFLRITDVEIGNIYMTGAATLTPGTDKPWDISWKEEDLKTPTGPITRNVFVTPIFNGAPTFVDFFVPEQDVKNNIYFKIYYRVLIDTDKYTGEMILPYHKFYTPKKWKVGVRYTYNIRVTMLPHIGFHVELNENETGYILDRWVVEPEINL